ncbi:MAG: CgeB family protein [Syntrophobacteraceae bacterium]
MRVLLVVNSSPEHLGAYLLSAAVAMGLKVELVDCRSQVSGPKVWRAVHWRLLGHRPTRLYSFSREVVAACARFCPDVLLATGQVALMRRDLEQIRRMGVKSANFVTDDPWNPAHRAGWFLKALPSYDWIFTPRMANISDFKNIGCANIEYLPFAYAPEVHFFEEPKGPDEELRFRCDAAFIGGGDRDRFAWMDSLVNAGVSLKLYGGYWERNAGLARCYCGFAYGADYRKAAAGARVNIVMGRKANRDDHAMRSYELAAMGACIVAEDTDDHRRLYGDDGALFVSNPEELAGAARQLLMDEPLRKRLARNAMQRVIGGKNSYRDRLRMILEHHG